MKRKHNKLTRTLSILLVLVLVWTSLAGMKNVLALENSETQVSGHQEANTESEPIAKTGFGAIMPFGNGTGPEAFLPGVPIVFLSQGSGTGTNAKFTLYELIQNDLGEIILNDTGSSTEHYNAIGFNQRDMYLYGMVTNDLQDYGQPILVRIGQNGETERVARITGVTAYPGPNSSFNSGAFGEGEYANTYFFRAGSNDSAIYKVDVISGLTSEQPLEKLEAVRIAKGPNIGNTGDMFFKDEYLWSFATVKGEAVLYRIDPYNGTMETFNADIAIEDDTYGAQWLYGNGNIGICSNTKGVAYQIQIDYEKDVNGNENKDYPVFSLISTMTAPTSKQNDGAAYGGDSVDLSIEKNPDKSQYFPGEQVTYTLVIKNEETKSVSSGFVVQDKLPQGLNNPTSPGDGVKIEENADGVNVLSYIGGKLYPGESIIITVTGTVDDDFTASLSNTATVLGNEADSNMNNNTSTATIIPGSRVTPPDLAITKLVDKAEVLAGDTLEYTITVSNSSDAGPASDVEVREDFPVNATFVSANPSQGSFDEAVSLWNIGDLAAGNSVTLTVVMTVDKNAEGGDVVNNLVTITNGSGIVLNPEDPDSPQLPRAEVETPVVNSPDVVTPVTGEDDTEKPGPVETIKPVETDGQTLPHTGESSNFTIAAMILLAALVVFSLIIMRRRLYKE